MAGTYANVTVIGADREAVVAALGDIRAAVGETVDDATVVFAAADEEIHNFGEGITAAVLAAACGCAALEIAVYEDQVFQYRVYRDGDEVDVGVVPTPVALKMAEMAGGTLPGADGARLVRSLGRGDVDLADRALAANAGFAGAAERHAALTAALGLPGQAAGRGYRDAAAEERPEAGDPA